MIMDRFVITAVTLAILAIALPASAQETEDRDNTWELGTHVFSLGSESLAGNEGSSLDVDSQLGWGISGAYNFNNRFALGVEFGQVSPEYQATLVMDDGGSSETVNSVMDITNLELSGAYYFFDSSFTPFVEAGIGYMRMDSQNSGDQQQNAGCWWDPWWGYICSSSFDAYSDSRTSYSGALGIRWDLGQEWSVRGSYGLTEFDTDSPMDNTQLESFKIDVNFRF